MPKEPDLTDIKLSKPKSNNKYIRYWQSFSIGQKSSLAVIAFIALAIPLSLNTVSQQTRTGSRANYDQIPVTPSNPTQANNMALSYSQGVTTVQDSQHITDIQRGTIEAWIWVDELPQKQSETILTKKFSYSQGFPRELASVPYVVSLTPEGKVELVYSVFYNDKWAPHSYISNQSIQPNKWQHIAVTIKPQRGREGKVSFFIHGQHAGEFKSFDGRFGHPENMNQGDNILIGSRDETYSNFFNGKIDEAHITTRLKYHSSDQIGQSFDDFPQAEYDIPSKPFISDSNTLLLMHFDNDLNDSSPKQLSGSSAGQVNFVPSLFYSGPTPVPTVEPTPTISQFGQAIFIDNSPLRNPESHVSIQDPENKLVLHNQGTIEFWLKPIDERKFTQSILFRSTDDTQDHRLNFKYEPRENYSTREYDHSRLTFEVGSRSNTAKNNLPLNKWVHIAITRSGRNAKLYYDGSFQQDIAIETDQSVPASPSANLYLGSEVFGTQQQYTNLRMTSMIDDMRISNTVRNVEKLWSDGNYHKSLAVDDNTLGYWKFDGDTNDSSNYGHHGIPTGNISYVTGVTKPTPTNAPTPTAIPTIRPTHTPPTPTPPISNSCTKDPNCTLITTPEQRVGSYKVNKPIDHAMFIYQGTARKLDPTQGDHCYVTKSSTTYQLKYSNNSYPMPIDCVPLKYIEIWQSPSTPTPPPSTCNCDGADYNKDGYITPNDVGYFTSRCFKKPFPQQTCVDHVKNGAYDMGDVTCLKTECVQTSPPTPTPSPIPPTPTPTITPPPNNSAPRILTRRMPRPRVGSSYKAVITLFDRNRDTLTLTSPKLPNGFTIDNCKKNRYTTRCEVVGTPTQAGNTALTLIVTDPYGAKSQKDYLLNIRSARKPNIRNRWLPSAKINRRYSKNIKVSSSNSIKPIILTAEKLAPGLELSSCTKRGNTHNCRLSGTPSEKGIYRTTITATDSFGNTHSRTYRFRVR